MEENFERGMAAVRWAVAHWEEWEIICGLCPADIGRNMEIYRQLKEDDLQELTEMMVSRIYTMMQEETKETEDKAGGSGW